MRKIYNMGRNFSPLIDALQLGSKVDKFANIFEKVNIIYWLNFIKGRSTSTYLLLIQSLYVAGLKFLKIRIVPCN